MNFTDGARLLADIGSTYARFALETQRGQFERLATLKCADYADFGSALRAYLNQVQDAGVRHAAVAISNPVEGDLVRMTNYHWQFSIEQTRTDCGLDTLLVVNDFTALAVGLPHLQEDQRHQVGHGQPRSRSVIGLLGAGTGLGMSGLIPADDGWISLGSEGGHTSFAPSDAREAQILAYAWRQYPHVSAERLVSGPGLELIFRALLEAKLQGKGTDKASGADKPKGTDKTSTRGKESAAKEVAKDNAANADAQALHLSAPEITSRGLSGKGDHADVCEQALDTFCGMLGTVAGNLAVTLGAFGGIYIGGAIVPRLGPYFQRSQFRARFEAKGRFSGYLANIPTYVITADNATFIGVAAILDAQLRKRGGASILDRIRMAQKELSPAERRVADLVLSRPRSMLNDPIMEIARLAQVSQPTVIRFCRSMGCEGLSDFKLRLASSLTGTIPVAHTQVTNDDTGVELGAKVLGNTASAILQIRDQLNRRAIDEAIEKLINARRIEFYAIGNYGVVAQDAQYKFIRFGLPTTAQTEPRLQQMAAQVLTPADVMVVISSTGRTTELNTAVDIALQRGAQVIAITTSQTPLAKQAHLSICLDHSEDVTTQVPMISRVLYLLVVDILAVGVAMRIGMQDAVAQDSALSNPMLDGLQDKEPDIANNRLARMVSHSLG